MHPRSTWRYHGWIRVDLSSSLSATYYGGATIVAKNFDIAQDLTTTNSVDIVLVINCNGKYYLHLATGFTNTFANWTLSRPQFTQYLFDYPGESSYKGLPIKDLPVIMPKPFVFPGGNAFTFKSAEFSQYSDLVCHVKYLNED